MRIEATQASKYVTGEMTREAFRDYLNRLPVISLQSVQAAHQVKEPSSYVKSLVDSGALKALFPSTT